MDRIDSPRSLAGVFGRVAVAGSFGRLLLAVAVLGALVAAGTRPAGAAGASISLASYQTTQVCYDGVGTKTSLPVSYLQVRGTGFAVGAPVIVEVIRVSNYTLARTYTTIYQGGKLAVNTNIRYCPPAGSTDIEDIFLVRAHNLHTMSYTNAVIASVCPGSSL